VPDVVSSVRGYRPLAARARDPVIAERALRACLALALFAGFFALGRSTAPTGGGEAAPSVAVSPVRSVAPIPLRLSEGPPLEHALTERATLEHAELARALAAAARARKAHRASSGTRGAFAATRENTVVPTEPPVTAPAAQPAPVTAPATQRPPAAPKRPSSSGSAGPGSSFDTSG